MQTRGRGDSGYTDLLGSERVPKYDERVDVIGTIDEATSAIGLARAADVGDETRARLQELQQQLYVMMAELATPPAQRLKLLARITAAEVEEIEGQTRTTEAQFTLPNQFILPGACAASAALDFARTVVRRAERGTARLAHSQTLDNREILRFLNRASSLLFALARYEEARRGIGYSLTERRRRQ
ncbi:MAG: cob(I)yrinic acid a,c-diamide adenosyltransferase [Chloroflexota bacterium]